MRSRERVFLDTNVLVYLFDRRYPKKRKCAAGLMKDYGVDGLAVLSTQVLQEFYWVVTRKMKQSLDPAVAQAAVVDFMEFPVHRVDETTILNGIERSRSGRLSFWDALVVESAVQSGCSFLLTEDLQHGSTLDGVTVRNPFR